MRVRGLKSLLVVELAILLAVAPHAGAWIEIQRISLVAVQSFVAPHAGAWIEISATWRRSGLTSGRTPCGCVD